MKKQCVKLALGCSSIIGETLAEIFIFFLESGLYEYVQRASDLRSLLNGWRVPGFWQCHRQHLRPPHLLLRPSVFHRLLCSVCIVPLDVGTRAAQQSFEEFGASGFSGGVNAELMCQRLA